MSSKLQQAITEIQEGNKVTGRQLLLEIIKSDPFNENAWLWMSEVVEHDESRRECLKKVLEINPNNKMAQQGLTLLQERSVRPAEKIEKPAAGASPTIQPRKRPGWATNTIYVIGTIATVVGFIGLRDFLGDSDVFGLYCKICPALVLFTIVWVLWHIKS